MCENIRASAEYLPVSYIVPNSDDTSKRHRSAQQVRQYGCHVVRKQNADHTNDWKQIAYNGLKRTYHDGPPLLESFSVIAKIGKICYVKDDFEGMRKGADMMNRTKDAIVAAFGELLTERPLSKITVKDIVDRCGINRNTFYYHFEGIPSLLEQTVKYMTDQIIQAHSKFGSPMDCIAPFVHYCTDNKKAILHIYRSVQREVFLTYLDRTAMYVVSQYVETATSGLFVSAAQNEEKNLLIRYYKCTLVGALLDWLDAGMKYDLLAAAESICKLFAGSGKQAFLKCLEIEN